MAAIRSGMGGQSNASATSGSSGFASVNNDERDNKTLVIITEVGDKGDIQAMIEAVKKG